MQRPAYANKDFVWARWTPAMLAQAAKAALVDKRREYAAIKHIPASARTFENTVYAIEASNDMLRDILSISNIHLNLHPDERMRAEAKRVGNNIRAALVDLEYDHEIYRAFQEYATKRESLVGEDKKLFEDMQRDYRRMGFHLPPRGQAALRRDLKQLHELETEFSENINTYDDHILVTRAELAGLPERYIASLRRDRAGRYHVSLAYPEYLPFMQLADNAKKRAELLEKNLRKGGQKNLVLLRKMIALRHANARRLGYADHVAFQLEPRMARTPAKVQKFLGDLLHAVRPKAQKELRALEALKRKHIGDSRAHLSQADLSYYSEKLRAKKFQIASETIREYFPLDTVLRGMFSIYERLLGLRFTARAGIRAWHPDVRAYEAVDRRGNVVGYFLLDLHPRPNKYGHAAAEDTIHGHIREYHGTQYQTPVAVMMTNFPKPTSSTPSLLSHDEVETLFHEFGHIMHQIVTRASYGSQSGSATVLDFVEAQSQMLENWVWDKKMLRRMSGYAASPHQPLPEQMLRALIRARKFMLGYFVLRQLLTGILDIEVHRGMFRQDPAVRYRELVQRYIGFALPPTSLFPAGLGHIGGGYDVGYYGYLWSLVYSADMFTEFKRHGLLDRRVGAAYRKNILEVGSSRPEMASVVAFLGRQPNAQAFLRELGLRLAR